MRTQLQRFPNGEISMPDFRLSITLLHRLIGVRMTHMFRKALQLFLAGTFALTASLASASSNRGVSLTCGGISMHVSVELYYLPPSGVGFGVLRKPELHLQKELEECSLDALYQQLLIRPEVVLNQSTEKETITVLTQKLNAASWDQVQDFRTVKLQDGMRVWITLFDVPETKLLQEDV